MSTTGCRMCAFRAVQLQLFNLSLMLFTTDLWLTMCRCKLHAHNQKIGMQPLHSGQDTQLVLLYDRRGGFCRFSSSRYTLDKANMKNLYMHLTNVAIQKKNEQYDQNTGMKWPISKLKQYLLTKYGQGATSKLFGDIQVHFSCLPFCA